MEISWFYTRKGRRNRDAERWNQNKDLSGTYAVLSFFVCYSIWMVSISEKPFSFDNLDFDAGASGLFHGIGLVDAPFFIGSCFVYSTGNAGGGRRGLAYLSAK